MVQKPDNRLIRRGFPLLQGGWISRRTAQVDIPGIMSDSLLSGPYEAEPFSNFHNTFTRGVPNVFISRLDTLFYGAYRQVWRRFAVSM
jgi:hypothetical protein